LLALEKICGFLAENGFDCYSLEKVESEIESFKGPGCSNPVSEPRFPWSEDERVIRVLMHLIGDGYGGTPVGGAGMPYYKNNCVELREEFASDLSFFGNVHMVKRGVTVSFPKVIAYIIKHLYRVKTECHESSLPPELWRLPKSFAAQALKALYDDEGSVDDARINFTSANYRLINEIRNLLMARFPEIPVESLEEIRQNTTTLNGKKFIRFDFRVKARGVEPFAREISFAHPRKKRLSEFAVSRQHKSWNKRPDGVTKLLILKSLSSCKKNTNELAADVFVAANIVLSHINSYTSYGHRIKGLRELGFVEAEDVSAKPLSWGLTPAGRDYLHANEQRLQ
jgi:hypothetical protein